MVSLCIGSVFLFVQQRKKMVETKGHTDRGREEETEVGIKERVLMWLHCKIEKYFSHLKMFSFVGKRIARVLFGKLNISNFSVLHIYITLLSVN